MPGYSVVNDPAMEKALDDDEPNGEAASIEFIATALNIADFFAPSDDLLPPVPMYM